MGYYEQNDIDAWLGSQTSWGCHLLRLSTCVSYFCVAVTQILGSNRLREKTIHFGSQCQRVTTCYGKKAEQKSSVYSIWSVLLSLVHVAVKQEQREQWALEMSLTTKGLCIFFGQMGLAS